jgi:hypothetical protein
MDRIYRATLFALYQTTLLAAIVLLPIAVLARQVGIELPVHRPVCRLGEKYDQAR